MAHIRRRKLANGKTAFQVRWTDPDGVERSRQFPPGRSDDAKRFKAEIEQTSFDGTYVDHSAGRVKFRQYADQWLANQVTRSTTVSQHETRLRMDVYPIFGDRRLNVIRRSDVLALFKGLSERLAPNTVHGTHAALSAVFNAAVLDRLIAASPVTRIPLPEVIRREIVIPTPDQVESIAGVTPLLMDGERLAGVPARMCALVLCGAMTGLRTGELLGMTLESVDLLRREVEVRPDLGQMCRAAKGWPAYLGPPKSAAGARTVPLSARAVDVLAAHLARWPADRDDGYGGLVFRGVRRTAMSDVYVRQNLQPVIQAHGFPPRSGMHLFRHAFASALIAERVDPKTIQYLLGHASIVETMDTYGHLMPDSTQLARDAIDNVFGAKGKTRRKRDASGE